MRIAFIAVCLGACLALSIGSASIAVRDVLGNPTDDPRLTYYAATHRLNPLFAIEGTDPTKLSAPLVSLHESEKSIAREYPGYEAIVASLRSWRFLAELGELEQERQLFLKDPSRESALSYHVRLMHALDAYEADAQETARALSQLPDRTLGLWAGTTSLLFMAETLHARAEAIEQMRSDEKGRFYCLTKWWYPCWSLRAQYPSVLEEFEPVAPPSERDMALQSALAGYVRKIDGSMRSPALVGLSRTSCLSGGGAAWFTSWKLHTDAGAASRLTMTDPVYFFDYRKRVSAGENILRDAGITVEYQFFNPYICVDFSHDAGAVASASALFQRIRTRPLFTCEDAMCATLMHLEQEIGNAEALDISRIEDYLIESTRLLGKHGEQGLADVIGEDGVRELERRVALWRGKSAEYDGHIAELDRIVLFTVLLAREGNLPFEIWAGQRGHYSVLFMSANQTFGPVSLFLQGRSNETIQHFPYRLYFGDVEKEVPLSMLSSFLVEELAHSVRVTREYIEESE